MIVRQHSYKSLPIDSRWARATFRFVGSPMANVSIDSLAQNLNIDGWPVQGERSTPNHYLNYTYDQARSLPEFALKHELIELLIEILEETLAFDQPMEDIAEKPAAANPVIENLLKLGVPLNFPMPLAALTPDAREFCKAEQLDTIEEFIRFGEHMSASTVVTGDLRALLNALSRKDEDVVAVYLPFRKGDKGLHLLEGIALCLRAYDAPVHMALAGREEADVASQQAIETICSQASAYVEYFQAEVKEIQKNLDGGMPLVRLVAVLKDPVIEEGIVRLLRPYFQEKTVVVPAATVPRMDHNKVTPKIGFFKRMFGSKDPKAG